MISKYKIVIEGKNLDYFISKLIKNNIFIYDLERNYKKLTIIINEEGLNKLKKIKTSYKYYIVDSYGGAKIKYLFKKYFFFLICLVLGVLINIGLSKIIFDVEVVHSNQYIRDIIYNNLRARGIYKYNLKVSYEKREEIVEEILKKETNDIEWMEIEEVGVKYIVKVEQRKKNKDTTSCSPRNVVAKKDAFVLEIQADEGEIIKKKYDYVKKGDIVISGVIHNKENIVSKRCATGKVFGEVWYQVNLEIPVHYREEIVTGRKMKQVEVNFLEERFTIFNDFKTYKRKVSPIFSSNLLPININFTEYLETNVSEYKYNLSNVSDKALELATSKLRDKLGDDSEILSKKVLKKSQKGSKIIVEVFVKVKEDITDISEIVETEE